MRPTWLDWAKVGFWLAAAGGVGWLFWRIPQHFL
jgi:hypothetical protein